MGNNEWLQKLGRELNLAYVGVADITSLDEEIRQSCPYGISIAISLDRDIIAKLPTGPHYEYFQLYEDVNRKLKEASETIASRIAERGFRAYSLADFKQDGHYRTPLPFKTLAALSGFGWIGKSATLITKAYGNAVRLNGILTDMPLFTGKPLAKSYCGTCTACVDACPANAIKGMDWTPGMDRDEMLDPAKCKAKVIERGKVFHIINASCGLCLSSCPWTRKYLAQK